MSEQIDYPLSSPLDELSEWQRVVRPLRVSADGYLRLATNRLAVDSDYTWEMHRHKRSRIAVGDRRCSRGPYSGDCVHGAERESVCGSRPMFPTR